MATKFADPEVVDWATGRQLIQKVLQKGPLTVVEIAQKIKDTEHRLMATGFTGLLLLDGIEGVLWDPVMQKYKLAPKKREEI